MINYKEKKTENDKIRKTKTTPENKSEAEGIESLPQTLIF